MILVLFNLELVASLTQFQRKFVQQIYLDMPSLPLIKKIVTEISFEILLYSWGIGQENIAKNQYVSLMCITHDEFSCTESCLFLHSQYTYIGATPVGKVNCLYSGEGCLGIKCPEKYKNKFMKDMLFNAKP